MSIKEKFHDVVGLPFELYEDGDLPEYIITMGPSRLVGLINTDNFTKVTDWLPFRLSIPFEQGFLTYEEESFNIKYVEKAIEVLDPDEYGVFTEYLHEKDGDGYCLALKKGNFAVIIAPAVKFTGNKDWPTIPLKDSIKEAPKSVNVL